jgi:hypothetical protein
VKEEAGAACFAAHEAPPYKKIRDNTAGPLAEAFDVVDYAELRTRYMEYMVQPRGESGKLKKQKAPVDNHPVVAPVIREAIRERDDEGALVLLRQLAYFETYPPSLGHPAPPWGRLVAPGGAGAGVEVAEVEIDLRAATTDDDDPSAVAIAPTAHADAPPAHDAINLVDGQNAEVEVEVKMWRRRSEAAEGGGGGSLAARLKTKTRACHRAESESPAQPEFPNDGLLPRPPAKAARGESVRRPRADAGEAAWPLKVSRLSAALAAASKEQEDLKVGLADFAPRYPSIQCILHFEPSHAELNGIL